MMSIKELGIGGGTAGIETDPGYAPLDWKTVVIDSGTTIITRGQETI